MHNFQLCPGNYVYVQIICNSKHITACKIKFLLKLMMVNFHIWKVVCNMLILNTSVHVHRHHICFPPPFLISHYNTHWLCLDSLSSLLKLVKDKDVFSGSQWLLVNLQCVTSEYFFIDICAEGVAQEAQALFPS